MEHIVLKEKILIKGLTLDIKLSKKLCINNATLKEENMYCFSCVGEKKGYGYGQISNILENKILHDKFYPKLTKEEKNTLLKLIDIWKKYQLNDLKIGTERQEKTIRNFNLKDVNIVEKIWVLEKQKMIKDNNHIYGTKWLCEKIPQTDIEQLIEIIEKLKK